MRKRSKKSRVEGGRGGGRRKGGKELMGLKRERGAAGGERRWIGTGSRE